MEEILASIRRIISDEGNTQGGQPTAAAESEPPARTTPPSFAPPKPVLAATQHQEADVFELTEVVETKTPPAHQSTDDNEVMFREALQTRAGQTPGALATRSTSPMTEEQLLSQHTSSAVSAAFDTLTNNMFSGGANSMFSGPSGSRTIEEVVREMLKPMLKTWLEENLPSVVERLVRAEIERVSRGGR